MVLLVHMGLLVLLVHVGLLVLLVHMGLPVLLVHMHGTVGAQRTVGAVGLLVHVELLVHYLESVQIASEDEVFWLCSCYTNNMRLSSFLWHICSARVAILSDQSCCTVSSVSLSKTYSYKYVHLVLLCTPQMSSTHSYITTTYIFNY